jgi:hypothetical protein
MVNGDPERVGEDLPWLKLRKNIIESERFKKS